MEYENITEKKLNLKDLVNNINIADLLTEDELKNIARDCITQYENDVESRRDREDKIQKSYDFVLNMNMGIKSYPWEGASNIVFPLITQGAMEFNAEAYPAVIQDGNIVKIKVLGSDDGVVFFDPKNPKQVVIDPATNQPLMLIEAGSKNQKACRTQEYCNNYILNTMKGFEENQDKLLIALPICGTMFKKIYFDTVENIAVNDLIFPKYLIVNNNAKNIDDAYAITHLYELSNNDIVEKQKSKIFKDCDLKYDNIEQLSISESNTVVGSIKAENKPQVILEQHTFLDLDHDGYKEPYIITIHESSKEILRIVARFEEKGIIKNSTGEILKIKPIQYFVKYSFIPNPDGSFYDLGFADFLYPLNKTINTLLNQLVDAGTLSNTSQGFIGNGLNIKGGNVGTAMGKFKYITNNTGDDIAKNIYQIKHPEPSATLFQLLGFIVDVAKTLSNQKDVLSGTIQNNIAPTTMMAQVEQGYKQFKAIYKRLYRALKDEICLIVDLIKENETQENYVKVLGDPNINFKEDFALINLDILPIADPNMITSLEKLSQANFLMQFIGNGNINQQELLNKIFKIVRVENTDKLINPPAPPMIDPLIQVEQAKLQQKTASDMANIQIKEAELQMKQQELQSKTQIELLRIENERLKAVTEVENKNRDIQIKQLEQQNEMNRIQIANNQGMVKAFEGEIKKEKSIAEIGKIKAETEKILSEANVAEPADIAENRRNAINSETLSDI